MAEAGDLSQGRNDARRSRRKIAPSGSALIRTAGALVGLASLLLPWGSIIVRDDAFATASVTGLGMADVITSSDLFTAMVAILFISATVITFIDGRAVAAQIAALICLWVTIPGLLAGRAALLSIPPGWSVSTSIASGFYLGLLSAVIQVVPFLPRRREARREAQTGLIGSERIRPEENPYHGGPWWK